MRSTVAATLTAVVGLAVACGASMTANGPAIAVSVPATASSPATATSAPTEPAVLAVIVGGGSPNQSLTIVGSDGKIYAKASPRGRSGDFAFQPWVSTSNTAAYYLDGDSALMRLRPGGSPVHIRDLAGSSFVHAVFAVSPDDRRIAVALLTYGPTPSGPGVVDANYQGMKLYVEDLAGSNHVDLFASSTAVEWPVGWHGAGLVMAVSLKQIPGLGLNSRPYYAFVGIHVVDAANGVRKATLCGGSVELGPATQAGVLCSASNYFVRSDWVGKETPTIIEVCAGPALQPNGEDIACADFGGNFLWSGGISRPLPAPPIGWVGSNHLVLNPPSGAEVFDVASGTIELVDAATAWTVLAIPGGL